MRSGSHLEMPSSRASRKAIKLGKLAASAERRVRAEIDGDPSAEAAYVTPAKRQRMRDERERLRAAFARLSPAQRVARAEDFKRKLRAQCLSHRAFQGAWDARFASMLPARQTRSGKGAAPRRTLPLKKEPEATPAALAQVRARRAAKNQERPDPGQAARALDVKIRLCRPSGEAAIARLAKQLNADRYFLEAFGGPVTEKQIHQGIAVAGRPGAKSQTKKPRKN